GFLGCLLCLGSPRIFLDVLIAACLRTAERSACLEVAGLAADGGDVELRQTANEVLLDARAVGCRAEALFVHPDHRRVHDADGGEAPGAFDEHADAEAEVLVARDVLHLLLARRDRFGAVTVDADVGVRSAEPFRGGEGDIGEPALGRVDLGGGGGFALEDPGREAHRPERRRGDFQKLAPDHSGPPYYLSANRLSSETQSSLPTPRARHDPTLP